MDSPGQDNCIIRINQKAFAGVNGESFFMIIDKALTAQNIMDDIDRADTRSPGMQIAAVLSACGKQGETGLGIGPKNR